MPGWWFTIESTTTRHFIQQFKAAVEDALRAKPAVRAIMRARATKQRFPVSQWVEDLEKLQSSAIDLSHKQAAKERRPTLGSPNTPAILDTKGVLNVLQARFTKASLGARPARPPLAQTHTQIGGLSSIAEGRLLAGPSPGLGSKMGPSSKRKPPPPPLLRNFTAVTPKTPKLASRGDQNVGESTINMQRPPMNRALSALSSVPRHIQDEQQAIQPLKRPTMNRAPTMPMPGLRPQDRKAVKLLGMQLPTNYAETLIASDQPLVLSDESSTPPTSAYDTPSTPNTPITPTSAIPGNHAAKSSPRATTQTASNRTSLTTATSVIAANSSQENTSNATSTTAASSVRATDASTRNSSKRSSRMAPVIVGVAKPIIHTPRAVDHFPSLGGHYFPHGSVGVLSTSEVQEERPDNKLQNVTPFFSDPKKEYEKLFENRLKKLNGKTSENQLCIEQYLLKSEKSWFGKLRAAEMSKPPEHSSPDEPPTAMVQEIRDKARDEGFGLSDDHKPPSGLKRMMLRKIGDWPVYSFLLAFVSYRELGQ